LQGFVDKSSTNHGKDTSLTVSGLTAGYLGATLPVSATTFFSL